MVRREAGCTGCLRTYRPIYCQAKGTAIKRVKALQEFPGQEVPAARLQVTRQGISPVLLGPRDLAEANESADLADVKLESPVWRRGSSLPPFNAKELVTATAVSHLSIPSKKHVDLLCYLICSMTLTNAPKTVHSCLHLCLPPTMCTLLL